MRKPLPVRQAEGPLFSFNAVCKGVVVSFLAYLILAALLAVVVYFWAELEMKFRPVNYATGLMSAAIGAFACGRRAGRAGWLHGLFSGALFVLASYYVGIFLWPTAVEVGVLGRRLLLGVAVGLAGGAIGANL
jgi:putative membrane protein (TIGR04086 family)